MKEFRQLNIKFYNKELKIFSKRDMEDEEAIEVVRTEKEHGKEYVNWYIDFEWLVFIWWPRKLTQFNLTLFKILLTKISYKNLKKAKLMKTR